VTISTKNTKDNRTKQKTASMLTIDTTELAASAQRIDPNYTSVDTQWNDVKRGVSNGTVSCFGRNITDTRLQLSDGQLAPCVRPPNLDETLGLVRADKIFVIDEDGTRLSVHEMLQKAPQFAAYRDMQQDNMDLEIDPNQPEYVALRFQEAFVPVKEGVKMEVVPCNFNYQTQRPDDPRNLIFCASAQGIFVHTDTPGCNSLYAHKKTPSKVTEHRFAVEETDFAVGAAQCGDMGGAKGKARAVEMGLEGMGPHSNCFMVLSVPNTQTKASFPRFVSLSGSSEDDDEPCMPVYRSLGRRAMEDDGYGTARSARVSVSEVVQGQAASRHDVKIKRPEKDGYKEPLVLTMLFYNTIRAAPGSTQVKVKSSDVELAIAHMNRLYAMCEKTCKLSELPAMLHKLTETDMARIRATRIAFGEQYEKETKPKTPAMDPFTPNANAAKIIGKA